MGHLRSLLIRFGNLFRKGRRERELAEELESHLQMHIEDNLRSGMTPAEARRQAMIKLGGVEQVKEECRDAWGVRIVNELAQDIRYGLRQLRRNPGFAAVAVITLALGIGANTAIFSVIYGALINPLPYKDSGRLAVLFTNNPSNPRFGRWAWVSPAEFLDYQEQNHVFDQVIGGVQDTMLMTAPNVPTVRFWGERLTDNTFRVLGMRPIIGRAFTAEDSKPGAPPVVLLNYREWQGKFGGDPRILGRTIVLNRQPTTVIGVMPPRFKWYGGGPDGWLPAASFRGKKYGPDQTTPVVGHLKPGVTIAQASADLSAIAKRLASIYPKSHRKGVIYSVKSLTYSIVDRETRRTFNTLMAGVGLLLLIGCVNVANLLLARASTRQHEIAIRAALGASRARLVRQFLLESLLLAAGGGILGCLLAWGGLNYLVGIFPPWYISGEAVIQINFPVLLFTAGVAVVSTLLFGLAPALHAIGKNLQKPLSVSGRATGGSHSRLQNLLVVGEVTLSLVLLTGAGLLFHSFWTLRHAELGYNISHVLDAWAAPTPDRYKTVERREEFFTEVLGRVRALPGVVSASWSWPGLNWAPSLRVEVPGQSDGQSEPIWYRLVGDRYFKTVEISLLAGRTISEEDLADARPVVVVNRAFAKKYFGNKSPLGRQIKVIPPHWFQPTKGSGFEIVGVVADTRHAHGVEPSVQPQVFLPVTLGDAMGGLIFVRAAGNPAGLVNAVRKQFMLVDKELPVQVAPIRGDFSGWYTEPRFVMGMLVGLALLGLVLASVGVFGVLSYSVSQRTQEFGIRMALGAKGADVPRMVLKWGLRWLAIGIVIGIPASIALAKLLQNRIWGIKSADPVTMVVVSLVLTAVGLVACYIPARRAAKVDPMVALRYE